MARLRILLLRASPQTLLRTFQRVVLSNWRPPMLTDTLMQALLGKVVVVLLQVQLTLVQSNLPLCNELMDHRRELLDLRIPSSQLPDKFNVTPLQVRHLAPQVCLLGTLQRVNIAAATPRCGLPISAALGLRPTDRRLLNVR